MRFVIASTLAVALAAGLAAPVIAQGPGQPAVSRAYTVEPFTPPTPVAIQGTGVRLRAEPFTGNTPVLSSGDTGLPLTVVGIARQPDWNWYQVILRNGQKAFIRSDLTNAPSRSGSTPTPVAQPPIAQPPIATPPVQPQPPVAYTPPVPPTPAYVPANPAPTYQPQPAQPLDPIPSRPLNNSGAISLTPGGPAPQLPPSPPASPTPAPIPAPANNGLISISPVAPTPSFNTPAPVALTPAAPISNATPAPTASLPPTVTHLGMAEQIRAQLNINRCWTDSSNMMDAHRLRAAFAVSFAPNGKFAAEPRLVEPAAEPVNDPAMMVFLAKARAALRTCNAMGFTVPQQYYSNGQGELKLEFSAR
jgi:hypothetical protein